MGARILVLGPDQGWHADQFRQAAKRLGHIIRWSRYETLLTSGPQAETAPGFDVLYVDEHLGRVSLKSYDQIMARTMPIGSLEQITLRLGMLQTLVEQGQSVINHPFGLEIAIDKFRTLARVSRLGFPTPETEVVQSRGEALAAFDRFNGDVVVKPIFGGEGRGVMRIRDRELAWYTFTTLEQLNAAIYVQRFIRPGGIDSRLLLIGDEVFGIRRFAGTGWKTNVAQGGHGEAFVPARDQVTMARRIASDLRLTIAAVDVIDNEDGPPLVLEVNAVPGWKGAQTVLGIDLAERMLNTVIASRPQNT